MTHSRFGSGWLASSAHEVNPGPGGGKRGQKFLMHFIAGVGGGHGLQTPGCTADVHGDGKHMQATTNCR
ncbi:MAG: hypothetical protein NTZ50_14325 [Chloroflexi bacterium]|nr:hypothetical protein [Chloroflexota bacterium]